MKNAKTISRMEMMKTGTVTDSKGRSHNWTREDFDRYVASYSFDDESKAAPVVLGHPGDNAPRLGYLSRVWREDDILCCSAEVVGELYDAMEQGLYPNRSIKIDLTKPLIYHLGILGAMMPAFADLAPVAFAASENENAAEFTSTQTAWRLNNVGDVFSNLREWIIAKFGFDDANTAIPSYVVDMLKAVVPDEIDDQNSHFGYRSGKKGIIIENPVKESSMNPDEIAAMKAENDRLKADNAAYGKAIADQKTATLSLAADTFAASLVAENRILPFQKDFVVSHYMSAAMEAEGCAEFGIGGAKESENPLTTLQAKYKNLPILGIVGKDLTPNAEQPGSFSAAELADSARTYMNANHAQGREIPFHVAVSEVAAGKKA